VDERLPQRKRRKKGGAATLLSMAGMIRDKPDVAEQHDEYL